MWRYRRRAAALLAVMAMATSAACSSSPPTDTNAARELAIEVFGGTQFTEPLQSNVTWKVGVPVWKGEEWAGLTQWPTAFNAVVTIHPDYLRRDVVAHEGGHVVCWWRWGRIDEECADEIMHQVLGTAPG